MAPPPDYGRSIFINCPFDGRYRSLFEAIIFTVTDCGFRARCTLEIEDSGETRIGKIFRIIEECRFGLHDVSRTEPDEKTGLPRFNMPLELGLFLGAKRYGNRQHQEKSCLILDRECYRYQSFISDIAGQDIQEHGDEPRKAITIVRNWLRASSHREDIPGGRTIGDRYEVFRTQLPSLCKELRLMEDELTFVDYRSMISIWLLENA
jgi:hypothetical protein